MRFFTAAFVSALATLASAASYTQPDYTQDPSGNAIVKPGLNEIVPAGKPYSITWQPTTEGPVSLVLLRGPSNNVVPLETLAVAIPNSGSYEWTPSSSLEPDTSHYGLLLVVEGTGQYQYSTQFGISNPDYSAHPSSSAGGEAPESTVIVTNGVTTTICPETQTAAPTTIPVVVPTSKPVVPTTLSSSAVPSGTPTGAPTVAPTQAPTTSGPSTPVFTGAADRMAISFGAVAAGVAAVLAF